MKQVLPAVIATFRFLNLDKMQAFTIVREVEGAKYAESNEIGRFMASVELAESRFDELTTFFVRQHIDINQCDIHIAAHIEQEAAQIAVPLVVNKLLKHIDCQITFSVIQGDLV